MSVTGVLKRVVDSLIFRNFILVTILAAATVVGLETYPYLMERYGAILKLIDAIILGIFVLEAMLKMAQHGRHFLRYFRDPWNVFDFTIVAVCLLPIGGPYAAVLRLARVLRTLRMVSALPKLQLLVGSLIKSLPSMVYVGMLLFLLFYIYAVMGVFLWRDNDPVHFRDLQTAFLSLFRVVTLEDWTDIMYTQMYGSGTYFYRNPTDLPAMSNPQPVLGAVYFVSFVLLGTMIMLNLFIGVIINSMSEAQAEREHQERRRHVAQTGEPTLGDELTTLEHRFEELVKELKYLRKQAQRNAGGP